MCINYKYENLAQVQTLSMGDGGSNKKSRNFDLPEGYTDVKVIVKFAYFFP